MHTDKEHAILYYGKQSKCVSEGEGRGENRERERVLRFLVLCLLVSLLLIAGAARVGATESHKGSEYVL